MRNRLENWLLTSRARAYDLSVLEKASGGQSIDVTILGYIDQTVARIHYDLGLDIRDTTQHELYEALRQRVLLDDKFLKEIIDSHHLTSNHDYSTKLKQYINKLVSPPQVNAIKNSVLKKIISDIPPQKTIDFLGYKNVKSLLRKLPIPTIMVIARYIEDTNWSDKLYQAYERLEENDFEKRQIKFVDLDSIKKLNQLPSIKRNHGLLHSKEAGVIGSVLTEQTLMDGYTIFYVSAMIHYINEILAFSGEITHQRFVRHIGEIVTNRLDHDEPAAHISNHVMSWRGVHNYLSNCIQPRESLFDLLSSDEKFIEPNDWLGAINERFLFWHNAGHCMSGDTLVISYNVIDISQDIFDQRTLNNHSTKFAGRALESYIVSTYLNNPTIRNSVYNQLKISDG